MKISILRIYDEAPHKGKGYRVLVDRLWPRGITKDRAELDEWCKELSPSPKLRIWYGHDPAKWPEFSKKYKKELDKKKDEARGLLKRTRKKNLLLLYGAKDKEHTHALVLKDFLESLPPSTAKIKQTDNLVLTDEDYEMLASFRFALRRFLAFSKTAARRSNLTPRQHQALLGIRAMQAKSVSSISDLAAFLILRHNSTVELVDRLIAAGLVKKAVDPEDGRRVILSLTKRGEKRLTALSQTHLDELEYIEPELQRFLERLRSYKRGKPAPAGHSY